MLFDPTRHERLLDIPWHEGRVRQAIADIVEEAERRFTPEGWWPKHPLDLEPGEPAQPPGTPLYHGACGVFWALHYLQDVGAVRLARNYHGYAELLAERNRAWLGDTAEAERASYLMGETPIRMWSFGATPGEAGAARLAELITGNVEHPARELMWGSPGTLLAALFLHELSGEARWAELFRQTAARLWSQLCWSDDYACHYWTQDLYGSESSYLGAVHGFVATALPLIRGRALLGEPEWAAWQASIANTVRRTATWDGALANWRAWLTPPTTRPMLMQFCHGAPGFVICLGGFPGAEIEPVLAAAGEAIWAAGPLTKGSNLCHGTGGNGYAFLKLWQRSGDPVWLQRARAFAMHGIAQTEAAAREHGRLRYSLWTGDPGFAIYLWGCLRGVADFPTLDVFYAPRSGA